MYVSSTLLPWFYPVWLLFTAAVAWGAGTRMYPFAFRGIAAALGPSLLLAFALVVSARPGAEFAYVAGQVASMHVAVALLFGFFGGHFKANRSR